MNNIKLHPVLSLSKLSRVNMKVSVLLLQDHARLLTDLLFTFINELATVETGDQRSTKSLHNTARRPGEHAVSDTICLTKSVASSECHSICC